MTYLSTLFQSFTSVILLIMPAFVFHFLGALPCGLFLARLFGYKDIRAKISGRFSSHNIYKATYNKKLAFLTFICNLLKIMALYFIAINIHHIMEFAIHKNTLASTVLRQIVLMFGFPFAIIGNFLPAYPFFLGKKESENNNTIQSIL